VQSAVNIFDKGVVDLDKTKLKWLVLTIAILTVITITVTIVNQINVNHQANLSKSEECIMNGGTVIVEKGFLSLSLYCED